MKATNNLEGVVICPCGSKYWDDDGVCHSCGERYRPDADKTSTNRLRPHVPNGILTVGELLEYLEGIDPSTQVLLDDAPNDWWSNITEVHFNPETPCVYFVKGEPFDTRQI